MSVAEIDSEKATNIVKTDPQFGTSNHCVVIMEQPPLLGEATIPSWRMAVTLTLRDPALGPEVLEADLPTVMVGPLVHKRQIVAIAKYPGRVFQWAFRFESDEGRSKARVWLHMGNSSSGDCGIFVVTHARGLAL
jgi:hypothetical protein